MSSRNVRKLFGSNSLPISNDSSEDDFEPMCTRPSTNPKFQGLELSSHSESENEAAAVSENEEYMPKIITKKNKKKNKKRQSLDEPGGSKDDVELDEIDLSVLEVNRLLGSPVEPVKPPEPVVDPLQVLMAINIKDLNSKNELRRLFGPSEEERIRRRRPDNAAVSSARAPIVTRGNYPPNYLRPGLWMSIDRREGDVTYFRFEHSNHYQMYNRNFLRIIYHTRNVTLFNLSRGQRHMHIELMLEYADMMFRAEEYRLANGLLEMTIDYLQIAAHSSFRLNDRGVRLEYKYMENRPFHVAILKYIYLLSNRACHRTALELAKLLMNLDPTDPLGVLLVIDTLALKAREFKWLIAAIECWTQDRQAHLLYNITFSNALAHFMVAHENKEDLSTADNLLRNAIMRFPTMVNAILSFVPNLPSNTVQTDHMFTTYAEGVTSRHVKEVVTMYADLTSARWREPAVVQWFLRNARELADQFDLDETQAQLQECVNIRYRCFPYRTRQAVRHMSIIRPMANLVTEGTVPEIMRSVAADPLPSLEGIDRYNYLKAMNRNDENHAFVRWFLAGRVPGVDEDSENEDGLAYAHARGAAQVEEMMEFLEYNANNVGVPVNVVQPVEAEDAARAADAPPPLADAGEAAQGNDGNPELHFLTRAMSNAVRSLLQAYRGYDADDEGEQQRRDNHRDGN